MKNGEAVNWIINLMADIGKAEHRDLWHYEQALSEIREKLESNPIPQEWIREQIKEHPGMHSASWSKLLRMWEERSKNGS